MPHLAHEVVQRAAVPLLGRVVEEGDVFHRQPAALVVDCPARQRLVELESGVEQVQRADEAGQGRYFLGQTRPSW